MHQFFISKILSSFPVVHYMVRCVILQILWLLIIDIEIRTWHA